TATVRQRDAGVRLSKSVRCAISRLSATGAASNSGTRRADSTGVVGDVASCGATAAGAFSACATTDTPETQAMRRTTTGRYHGGRRGIALSRDLGAGDDGRSPIGARGR